MALRHRALLDLKSELAGRGIRPDTFRATSKNVTQLLSSSKHDRIRALRESVVSATIYPAILLGVALLSLVGMLGFVVPQFEKLFKDMGDALPLPTRIVMLLGQGFKQHGLLLAIGAVLIGWLGWRWLRSPVGRAWWQYPALRLPVL